MIALPKLNLPDYDIRLKKDANNDVIFDPIRKKYIILTPEEWVRQHFINLLINHLRYPRGLMSIESGISYNNRAKRTDITVKNKDLSTFMVIECKSTDVKIDRDALNQISLYNKELMAPYICITNGLKHFIWHFEESQGYIQLKDFPQYKLE